MQDDITPSWQLSGLDSILEFDINRYGQLFSNSYFLGNFGAHNEARMGALFNNPRFFGLAWSETIARSDVGVNGAWGGDSTQTPASVSTWPCWGGNTGSSAGLFSLSASNGGAHAHIGTARAIIAGS